MPDRLDRLNSAAERLQARIDEAEEAGIPTGPMESELAGLQAQLQDGIRDVFFPEEPRPSDQANIHNDEE